MDGLKLEFSDESWVLLRPSRTKPVVRVYAEAPSIQERDELLEAACDIARGEAGISGFDFRTGHVRQTVGSSRQAATNHYI